MKTCSVDGCETIHRARGFCHTHYNAARRSGLGLADTSDQHLVSDVDPLTRLGSCSICGPKTPTVRTQGRPACAIRSRQRGLESRQRVHIRDYHREYNRRWRFSLPPGGIEALLAEQDGTCAICLQALDITTARIDHDHSCCPDAKTCGGCIRGVLCGGCNTGLGIFRDDPAVFLRAIEYLQSPRLKATG